MNTTTVEIIEDVFPPFVSVQDILERSLLLAERELARLGDMAPPETVKLHTDLVWLLREGGAA
jgi:hypothetical protein